MGIAISEIEQLITAKKEGIKYQKERSDEARRSIIELELQMAELYNAIGILKWNQETTNQEKT